VFIELPAGKHSLYNALNLDGGGSTTMAMQNPVTGIDGIINVSSDNPSGRAVGSNLVVFAAPVPEPASFVTVGLVLIALIAAQRAVRRLG
jgi:hypothetical protein